MSSASGRDFAVGSVSLFFDLLEREERAQAEWERQPMDRLP